MKTMKWLGCWTMLGVLAAAPAVAQDRTSQDYDRELGVKYALLFHEGFEEGGESFGGDWTSFGFLVEGAFRVFEMGSWQGQIVAEYAFARFGDYFDAGFDTTYNQLGGGVRVYRLFTPRVRGYGQFVLAWQNDGIEVDIDLESNNAVVYQPGGGLNIALTRMLDAQVQFDIPFANYKLGVFNEFRMGFGIGIPLGGR